MKQNLETHSLEELEKLILDPYIKNEELKHKILFRRQALLNEQFDFIKNRKHIERVNNVLLQKMNELYDKMKLVKEDLDERIASGRDIYKNYHLEGRLYFEIYDGEELSPERYMLSKLCEEAKCHWCIHNDSGEEMQTRTESFLDELNWDIEIFKPIQDWRLHICYATHAIFSDDFVLSLQDMALLEEKDICTLINISLI